MSYTTEDDGRIGAPAYQRVADDLRAQIVAGTLKIGDPIPSTTQLCQRYDVSATVVRAAVAQLRNDRIVRGQPGKAVYVVSTPEQLESVEISVEKVSADLERLTGSVAELRAHLMDLYARTGNQYPRGERETVTRRRDNAG